MTETRERATFPPPRQTFDQMIRGNQTWVERTKREDPTFFDRLAQGQSPEFLWIGCADSRVPATQVVDMMPGDIFVHRNVANVVVHSDMNLMTVLDYAVTVLQVRHIVVCGHYGCGGVAAALTNDDFHLPNHWLRHIKDVYFSHADELEAITDVGARAERLVELNVQTQLARLAATASVQRAWARGQSIDLRGCVYRLDDGMIREVCPMIRGPEDLAPIYRYHL